jgi:hypothetical protein
VYQGWRTTAISRKTIQLKEWKWNSLRNLLLEARNFKSNHGPPALQAASAAHRYPRIAPLMSLFTDQKIGLSVHNFPPACKLE